MGRGIYGGYYLCVSSFTLEILGCTCVYANSCDKFEAKISEKKGKQILEVNKPISCETDLCSLTTRFEAHPSRHGRSRRDTAGVGADQREWARQGSCDHGTVVVSEAPREWAWHGGSGRGTEGVDVERMEWPWQGGNGRGTEGIGVARR